jgi:hypothetical protein
MRPVFDCKNDAAAIEKAKILAIGVSFDKPEVDRTRHIAVRDNMGKQVSPVSVYSTPSEEHPAGQAKAAGRMTSRAVMIGVGSARNFRTGLGWSSCVPERRNPVALRPPSRLTS